MWKNQNYHLQKKLIFINTDFVNYFNYKKITNSCFSLYQQLSTQYYDHITGIINILFIN